MGVGQLQVVSKYHIGGEVAQQGVVDVAVAEVIINDSN
uniref:Uncharacterized protein n=1 Tax=viral metagenome TaxID=1070528 RepID=A0A6C0KQ31_9ZZZZ